MRVVQYDDVQQESVVVERHLTEFAPPHQRRSRIRSILRLDLSRVSLDYCALHFYTTGQSQTNAELDLMWGVPFSLKDRRSACQCGR